MALSYNRSHAEAEAAASVIQRAGRRAHVVSADLSHPDDCRALGASSILGSCRCKCRIARRRFRPVLPRKGEVGEQRINLRPRLPSGHGHPKHLACLFETVALDCMSDFAKAGRIGALASKHSRHQQRNHVARESSRETASRPRRTTISLPLNDWRCVKPNCAASLRAIPARYSG